MKQIAKETLAALAAMLLSVNAAVAAAGPAAKCEAGKNQESGKYAFCLHKAEAKLLKTKGACSVTTATVCYHDGDCPMGETCTKDLTKYSEAVTNCEDKYAAKWNKLETKAAEAMATCPDEPLLQADVKQVIDECVSNVASGLAGEGLPDCAGGLPASGQTTAYGPGSDGAVRAGAPLSYTDNGDGTITDNNTGLMWEKKDDSGGIHDKDNVYTWGMTSSPYTMNGTMVTTFLTALNGGGGFAGYTDWRIPNPKELQSIVDYEIPYPGPTVNAAFHQAGTCTGCTDVTAATCSCTASDLYWSSSTYRYGPYYAWYVYFGYGSVGADFKDGGYRVRAVRGGL